MSQRTKPTIEAVLYAQGVDNYLDIPAWGTVFTAAEMAADMSEFTNEEFDPDTEGFYQAAQVSLHRSDAYAGSMDYASGFWNATDQAFYFEGLKFIDDPVNALIENYQLAATQVDLRYFTPEGENKNFWTDKILRPRNGWPIMIQTAGPVPADTNTPDRDTFYDASWSQLTSNFTLPQNPQFAFALWVTEGVRLVNYAPVTEVIFGDDATQVTKLVFGADGKVVAWHKHLTATSGKWVQLPKIKGGSVKMNGWKGWGPDSQVSNIDVVCIGHGIAVSSDNFRQNLTFFRLPHGAPTIGDPYGSSYAIPSSKVGIRNNVGQWGLQWFELKNLILAGGGTATYPYLLTPLIKIPYDAADTNWPVFRLKKFALGNLIPEFLIGQDSGTLTEVFRGKINFKSLEYTSGFTPVLTSYNSSLLRNTSTANVDFVTSSSPLLYSVHVSEYPVITASDPAIAEDMAFDDNSYVSLQYKESTDSAPSGTVEIGNREQEAVGFLAEKNRRNFRVRGGWDTVASGIVNDSYFIDGYIDSWDVSDKGTTVKGILTTPLSLLYDKKITGFLGNGEGVKSSDYIEYLLAAIGMDATQYTGINNYSGIEDLSWVGAVQPVGTLNIGFQDTPLWYPEDGRSVVDIIKDIMLYSFDAGLSSYTYNSGGEAKSCVTVACRWCGYKRSGDPSNIDYWGYHNGPNSDGCRAVDTALSAARWGADYGGILYPCYTRGNQRPALIADMEPMFAIIDMERTSANIADDYFNHVIVKGPAPRSGGTKRQIAFEARDVRSIKGEVGYDFALGYERTAPTFQRDWITTDWIARRVAWALYIRYQAIADGVTITIPFLPEARVGHTFCVLGGEHYGVDRWVFRISEVDHSIDNRKGPQSRGVTKLSGYKITTTAAF